MPNIKTSCKLKNNKSSCNCKYKIISAILAVVVVGLVAAVVCLTQNQKSEMDKKLLVAFESLASSYIGDGVMFTEEYNEATGAGRNAAAYATGITADNDLYIDFLITNYQDHIPLSRTPARLHFQCANRSGKIFNTDNPEGCAMAYWYGDPIEVSEADRATYARYVEGVEAYAAASNSAETEAERARIATERDAFLDEFSDFFAKEREIYENGL